MEFYPSEQIKTDAPNLQAASDQPSFNADPSFHGGPAIVGSAAALGAAAGVAASGSSSAPANLLRGTPNGVNALRDQPAAEAGMADEAEFGFDGQPGADPAFQAEAAYAEAAPSTFAEGSPQMGAFPATQPGLAQSAPGFAASAQQFDQGPAGFAAGAGSTAGLGAPQPTAGSWTDPASTPDRMASLPNDSRPSIDAVRGDYQPAAMAQPAAAVAIDPSITLDSPGERRLEGAQTPSIIIQKRAPAEVKVGKPASFVVHVQNVGSVEALNVEVHDRVPAGMRLVDASPSPIQQENMLMWELGAMPAGDERTITMQLIPEQEGELGSVARVSFEAAASVRTISTRPELKIVQRIPGAGRVDRTAT